MGLIKTIFGAIFGIIGGIFKAIGGLVGLGKKSEFYLELDDSNSGSPSPELPKVAPQVEKPAVTQESAPVSAAAKPEMVTPAPVPVKPVPAVGNFATDYLVAPSSAASRRRPGPSLSLFIDMAKQVKLPSGAR